MKGAEAEDRALAHLLARGHVLLARNFRVRGGELDLVTRDGAVTVFTEVKQRARPSHGHPLESVTPRKADLLRRVARLYLLKTFGSEDISCRFDVVAISGPPRSGELLHLEDVF